MKLGLLASLMILGTTVQASGQSLMFPVPAETEPEIPQAPVKQPAQEPYSGCGIPSTAENPAPCGSSAGQNNPNPASEEPAAETKPEAAPPIEVATGRAALYGALLGMAEGMLLLGVDEPGGEVVAGGLTGALAGGIAGKFVAERSRATSGQVTFTAMASLAGLWTSELLYVSAVGAGSDGGTTNGIVVAMGLNSGLVAGGYLAQDLQWSVSRANFVAVSGALGSYGGYLLSNHLGTDFVCRDRSSGRTCSAGRVHYALLLGGMWLGFGGAFLATSGMNPDTRFRSKSGKHALSIVPTMSGDRRGISFVGDF